MMTGMEYKQIREVNLISQQQIARKVGRSTSRVHQIEREEYVPAGYVRALSELLGVDLFKKENLELMQRNIPEKYKRSARRFNQGLF
jgi:ribosome-binding protein aMBF1 (putative translation factor)